MLFAEESFTMKLKQRYWSLVIALVIPITFAGAHPAQRLGKSGDDSTTRQQIAQDFGGALLVAGDHYAGQIDFSKLNKSAILGMLHTLDPHSNYFDPKEWEKVQQDQRSTYTGIGSTIAPRNDKVYIMSPFDGTPAYRGGVRYGDQIVEINGESTENWTSLQVSQKLLGPEGTQVTVKVSRLGASQPLEFKFTREGVGLASVTNYYMAGNGIGYIDFERGFNLTSYDEIRTALADLQKQGMTSLILDLRNNPGGLVDQAKKITNLFLYRGQPIVTLRGRPQVFPTREEVATNNSPETFPIVVLINSRSASASEIVAGALQDHDRAVIVGENSFGKGLVQSVFPLSDGSGLWLVTGHFYTPSGRLIQREYANRSFYDYYLKRGDKGAVQSADEKHTDTGRAVFGGGGIQPDTVVKFPVNEIELQRTWVEPVFQFTRTLVAGQVPGLGDFKIDHVCDHKHRLAATDYPVGDKVLAAFKTFVRAHKELKADDSRVDKDADWLKRRIRYEVASAAYGEENARAALADGDVQIQRALAEVPKARTLAEDIRRMHASGGTRRN
jgi:carboxyl-terminal processing protease